MQRRFDKGSDSEEVAALRDIDGSEFAGPPIHILKDVPVDSFQMRHVEPPYQRRCVEFNEPRRSGVRLEGVKL